LFSPAPFFFLPSLLALNAPGVPPSPSSTYPAYLSPPPSTYLATYLPPYLPACPSHPAAFLRRIHQTVPPTSPALSRFFSFSPDSFIPFYTFPPNCFHPILVLLDSLSSIIPTLSYLEIHINMSTRKRKQEEEEEELVALPSDESEDEEE
jgi:hypothetical protein